MFNLIAIKGLFSPIEFERQICSRMKVKLFHLFCCVSR